MNKTQLLQELSNNTWVMIQPSAVHGIGVFAVRDIPVGCREMFSGEMGEWTTIPRKEMDVLPAHAKSIVENYCLYDEQQYYVPAKGFKVMDLSLFLNHSDRPNIISIDDGAYFEAIAPIKQGEELFIDYGTIVDAEE